MVILQVPSVASPKTYRALECKGKLASTIKALK